MMSRPLPTRCSRLALALVLPALLLRALVPLGFMPELSAGGHVSIGLCPGVMPGHGGHGSTHDQAPTHHSIPCPYSAAAPGAPLPAMAEPVSFAVAIALVTGSPAESLSLPAIYRAQAARGPPADSPVFS